LIKKEFKERFFKITETIKKYRLSITLFLIIFISGFLIRYWACFDKDLLLYFSNDDVGHSNISGYNKYLHEINYNLKGIFINSYVDAHPALRNILINILYRYIDNIYQIRLVSFIPGLILIPTFFVYGFSIFYKKTTETRITIGLICATIASFSSSLITLSIETRPYMMMLVFEVLALVFFFLAVERKSNLAIPLFFLFSSLACFSDYSPVLSILCLSLLLVFSVIFQQKISFTKISLTFVSGLSALAFNLFQLSLLIKKGSVEKYTQYDFDYISRNYLNDFKAIFGKLSAVFYTFFGNYQAKPLTIHFDFHLLCDCLTILFIVALIYLYYKKEYLLLLISALPVVAAIVAAFAKVQPFGLGRQNVYLVPYIFIPICFIFCEFYPNKMKLVKKLILSAFLILFILGQGFSLSIVKTIDSFALPTHIAMITSTKPKEFLYAYKWVRYKAHTNQDVVLVDQNLNRRMHLFTHFERMKYLVKNKEARKDATLSYKELNHLKFTQWNWAFNNICVVNTNENTLKNCFEKFKNKENHKYKFIGFQFRKDFDRMKMKEFGFKFKNELDNYDSLYIDLYTKMKK
jgi:hypothetical protein